VSELDVHDAVEDKVDSEVDQQEKVGDDDGGLVGEVAGGRGAVGRHHGLGLVGEVAGGRGAVGYWDW